MIEKPLFGYGNVHNDYGLGFYCTGSQELATNFEKGNPKYVVGMSGVNLAWALGCDVEDLLE